MIRAMIETSLVDWDGKITTVLFFDKCNFMCPFCQNWELMMKPGKFPPIEWQDIEAKLIAKKKWIDGVVLTGGEPFVFGEEVFSIGRKIKDLGFLLKIDTNGACPDELQRAVDDKLADYVAMDIKAPLDERYYVAAGVNVNIEKIKRSISQLINGRVDYEFRTTCVPGLINEETISAMGESIRGARSWILQQYVPDNAYIEEYRNLAPVSATDADKYLHTARRYVPASKWRSKNADQEQNGH